MSKIINRLSDIVNVTIDIQAPVVDSTSFDHILLLGNEPAVVYNADGSPVEHPDLEAVCKFTGLEGVSDAGFDTVGDNADAIGKAASIAFGQKKKPDAVYAAIRQRIAYDKAKLYCEVSETIPDGVTDQSITSEDGPFIVVCHPVVDGEYCKIKKDGYEFSDVVAVTDENTVYELIALKSVNEGVFEIDVPQYSDFNNKNIKVKYYVSWHPSETSNGMSRVQVVNLSDYEDIEDTLNRALYMPGWYVICPVGLDSTMYEDIAEWTEAQTKLCVFPLMSSKERENFETSEYFRSYDIFCKEEETQEIEDIPESNLYAHVAFTVRCLGYDAGSETWAFKDLSQIEPAKLTATQMARLKDELNSSYYTTYASKNITQGGKVMAGEWIDVIRFRDWQQNDMQMRIFNLFVVNPKIPYTDDGISLIQNAMIASLKAGQKRGGIAGDEYDSDGNLIPGFVTSVPLAANITDSEKASRILKDCKFKARLAGAIHVANIDGSLTYSL